LERAELAGWLRLSLTPGIGDGAARRLLAAFGLPERIFAQRDAALREVVTQAQAAALQQTPTNLQAQIDLTWQWLSVVDNGVARRVVTLGDAGYPASLLEMTDPPLMLYVLGAADYDLTQLGHSIAERHDAARHAVVTGVQPLPGQVDLCLQVDGALLQCGGLRLRDDFAQRRIGLREDALGQAEGCEQPASGAVADARRQ
jgi:hypothetical protein